MKTIAEVRQNLLGEIKKFAANTELPEIEKELLKSALYYSDEDETWGSLARGTLVLLLTNCHYTAIQKAIGIELLHHASLIVDDIIDNAIERRGRKAFWRKYGINVSILFAHKLVSMAGNILKKDMCFFETLNNMLSSEIASQLQSVNISTIKEYEDFVSGKTGKLYGLMVSFIREFNDNDSIQFDLIQTSLENIGISHQILDDKEDYNNKDVFLTNEAYKAEKNLNFYNLEKYGYTKVYLEKYHYQIGTKALNILNSQLKDSLFVNKKSILELCGYIAFGKNVEFGIYIQDTIASSF